MVFQVPLFLDPKMVVFQFELELSRASLVPCLFKHLVNHKANVDENDEQDERHVRVAHLELSVIVQVESAEGHDVIVYHHYHHLVENLELVSPVVEMRPDSRIEGNVERSEEHQQLDLEERKVEEESGQRDEDDAPDQEGRVVQQRC